MKPPTNIDRIKYLAYYHKKARVRKKNLKRLTKFTTISKPFKVNRATLFGENWHIGSYAGLFSLGLYDNGIRNRMLYGYQLTPSKTPFPMIIEFPPTENVDRCVCCGEIVPEGRQICPICERR